MSTQGCNTTSRKKTSSGDQTLGGGPSTGEEEMDRPTIIRAARNKNDLRQAAQINLEWGRKSEIEFEMCESRVLATAQRVSTECLVARRSCCQHRCHKNQDERCEIYGVHKKERKDGAKRSDAGLVPRGKNRAAERFTGCCMFLGSSRKIPWLGSGRAQRTPFETVPRLVGYHLRIR